MRLTLVSFFMKSLLPSPEEKFWAEISGHSGVEGSQKLFAFFLVDTPSYADAHTTLVVADFPYVFQQCLYGE